MINKSFNKINKLKLDFIYKINLELIAFFLIGEKILYQTFLSVIILCLYSIIFPIYIIISIGNPFRKFILNTIIIKIIII